jgi:DNA repair protein RecO
MIEFEGIVLSQYSSSEHSAMIVMLTKEGKKSFFARGILKTNHPHGALCSVGSMSLVQCQIGKQGALTLTSGKLMQSPLNRFHDSNDLFVYQLFIELVARIDMDIDESWYEWFTNFSKQFNTRSGLFILGDALYDALEKLGININFSSCAKCGNMEGIQDFSLHDGGLLCTHCVVKNKRTEDLTWIKTMITHFHYHREGIQKAAMLHWIKLALQHLDHELNLQLVSGKMILNIH